MASGQVTPGRIKPVERYVQGKDTFAVFTIFAERQIAYRLQSYKIVIAERDTLLRIIDEQDSLISFIGQALGIAERQRSLLKEQIQVKESQLTICNEITEAHRKQAKKYLWQRNAIVIGAVTVIGGIILLL